MSDNYLKKFGNITLLLAVSSNKIIAYNINQRNNCSIYTSNFIIKLHKHLDKLGRKFICILDNAKVNLNA